VVPDTSMTAIRSIIDGIKCTSEVKVVRHL
jgi:hypothetical protein